MPLSIKERRQRYQLRHPEKFTAEYRHERRKEHDRNYRKTENYKRAYRKYRSSQKYKDIAAEYHLKKKYGIDFREKMNMFYAQGGLCDFCRRPLPDNPRKCHTDHRHSDGKIRGLLHGGCNLFIGMVEEDPERIQQVKYYLEKYK